MGWSAFAPKGPSITIAVTTSASTGVQAPCFSGEPQNNNYLVSNSTSQGCFLGWGANAAEAQTRATVAAGLWLPGNSVQSFTFAPTTFFSVIAPATTSTVYIAPGDGM